MFNKSNDKTSVELSKQINSFKKKYLNDKFKSKNPKSIRICSDLLAGITVGGIIGYQMDKYFLTLPIFFIICLIFGSTASVWSIYKNYKN